MPRNLSETSTKFVQKLRELIIAEIVKKGTVQLVVGEEKTTVTMLLNKNLWLEINANTSSNDRMPARHRSL